MTRWPVLLLFGVLHAQPVFDRVLYGVSYYHEYMPEERLDRDVSLMKAANLSVVRLGESTWSSFEPRDGVFEFAWMDRILDKMQSAGIKVIFGTPTYSIPPWLYKKHPEIVVTRYGAAPPMSDPYTGTYPGTLTPGAYGPRQNMDLTNPDYRRHAERIIRKVCERYAKHPAVIGFQVDNETGPNGLPLANVQKAFVERLKEKYGTPQVLNKAWGLTYWGQLVDNWAEFPERTGILNPGYKLEWERFQQDIVTEFLSWQAKIVREYSRKDQFITHNFVGGVRTNLNQPAIAAALDIAAVNPYYTWQKKFDGHEIALAGDITRSLKQAPYLVTETNAQTIGWDSRSQYPPYDGQLRLAAYAHVASGAQMVAYWHWHSLHYGQETYWKGLLGHDLEPNRAYREATRIGAELKEAGAMLTGLKKDAKVAILLSLDSNNAIQFMPFNDRVSYLTVLNAMHRALYDMNVECDFVFPGVTDWARYKVLLAPPLYSADDRLLAKISDYVEKGGTAVVSFKSGFTNEHSTVRHEVMPGPLRKAAGIRYQEFTSLAAPVNLLPEGQSSVWAELIETEGAQVVRGYDDPFLRQYAAVTRHGFGKGSLVYEGTYLDDRTRTTVMREVLVAAGLIGPEQRVPSAVRVKTAVNGRGERLRFLMNFSGETQRFANPFSEAGAEIMLEPWGVRILKTD